MLEMVVFAVTLVVAQTAAAIALMAVFMSRRFIKYYYKQVMRIIKDVEDIVEEMEDELD